MAKNCTKVALLAAAALLGFHAPSSAQNNSPVEYRVKKGDTLIELARKYFVSPSVINRVMTINGIRNPRRLPIGKVLKLPRNILSSKQEPLRVLAVSGDVEISSKGRTNTAKIGDTILQGTVISTDAKEFISLGGTGNSRISLPSNSSIRIRGAKRYHINDAIDFDVRVLRGRSSVKAPKLKRDERYNVGTPRAVTAVRGTEFRVAFDDNEELSLTEVTEGEVLVASGGSEVATPAGSGVSASLAGLGETETLLTKPVLVDATKTQTDKAVTFRVKPLSDATAYRTQVARDVGFIEIIAEKISESPEVTFDDLPDGRLSVRSRGIAESGLEGFSAREDFRRKRVGATAGVEPSPFADAFKFVWLPEGEGNSFGAFQLWDAGQPGTLLVDEVGLDVNGFYVSNLKPGKYQWRIATFLIDEGEVIKVWTPAQDFTVTE